MRFLRGLPGWGWLTLALIILMSTPLWVLFSFVFEPTNATWSHLSETLLPQYVANSIWLMLGVGVGTLLLGVPTAWFVSQYEFRGRQLFQWALLLPMAMPAYIIAYTYTGLLVFEGPVQSALREVVPLTMMRAFFPEIRSLGGAIVMFSLVLYPYVYLLSRAAFANHSQQAMDASRLLGAGPVRSFFQVALPMARPAIIAGLTLALMETLADFGTVEHFGVAAFTTGIYRTWTGFGDTVTTAHLSLLLLAFVLTLMAVELWSRRQARYFALSAPRPAAHLPRLRGRGAWLAVFWCSLPVVFGFLVPGGQLLYWAVATAETGLNAEFALLVWNSFYLALIAGLVVVALAVWMAYAKRLFPHPMVRGTTRVAMLGYAVPGTVLAVAVMIPFAWVDQQINAWVQTHFGVSVGLLLSGTLFALVFAYAFRFLSVALQTVDAGLQRIKPSMDESARMLGANATEILGRIHLPLLRTSLLTAFILVFVEVLKELPMTLILRPFDFNTLAVRAYEMAADERLADAGLPALLIVLTGILPVIYLSRLIGKSHA
ncbi:iron ABC transporter permease [Thiomicrospira sp. WB1]|uniref:ABC transporter permease n=1 Tax=Thiomicrospira sp. WB1 TaxID=1685380 RepID=UPI00074762C6|nr:iron ABC transporter permease [Thiomicrospira sp. WB1]KUJ72559.1 iron ABC transporter permease [Thiomicrospira sp. WB1]